MTGPFQFSLKVLRLTAVAAVITATWFLSPCLTFLLIYLGMGVLLAIRIGERGLMK